MRRDQAQALVDGLQGRLVTHLAALGGTLVPATWARDGGTHGGGVRFEAKPGEALQRASVNVSFVHYDDLPERPLDSATALSAIVHPAAPRAPSLHLHVSWTALKRGTATWRVMADLNPSHPDEAHRARFLEALAEAAGSWLASGLDQGDRYFEIPALGRRRGVAHFYLEGLDTGDFQADLRLADRIAIAAIDTYVALVREVLERAGPPSEAERAAQLAYHTLYLFQVLTLDRGTTSGLLVHDQNDLGILGSLPARIDRGLLASWAEAVPELQRPLVEGLVRCIPPSGDLTNAVKLDLAREVRSFYRAHPAALALQASGGTLPPTVANHRG